MRALLNRAAQTMKVYRHGLHRHPCREMPGELERIMQWFKTYKLPDGKPENSFGFDEKPVDRELARQVINETHDAYKALMSGQRPNDMELSLR